MGRGELEASNIVNLLKCFAIKGRINGLARDGCGIKKVFLVRDGKYGSLFICRWE